MRIDTLNQPVREERRSNRTLRKAMGRNMNRTISLPGMKKIIADVENINGTLAPTQLSDK